jgi:hypothetical protein
MAFMSGCCRCVRIATVLLLAVGTVTVASEISIPPQTDRLPISRPAEDSDPDLSRRGSLALPHALTPYAPISAQVKLLNCWDVRVAL